LPTIDSGTPKVILKTMKSAVHTGLLLVVLSTFAQDEHKANTVRIPDVATAWDEKINLIQICR
jgi:hypothetical protein